MVSALARARLRRRIHRHVAAADHDGFDQARHAVGTGCHAVTRHAAPGPLLGASAGMVGARESGSSGRSGGVRGREHRVEVASAAGRHARRRGQPRYCRCSDLRHTIALRSRRYRHPAARREAGTRDCPTRHAARLCPGLEHRDRAALRARSGPRSARPAARSR